MAKSSWKHLAALAGLVIASGIGAPPAASHPHVRIGVEVTFVVRDGWLRAVKQRWTFDEAFRASTLAEFDKNQNGILEADELAAFRKLSADTMQLFDSFTVVWQGRFKAALDDAVITDLDMQTTKPTYQFMVALKKPVALSEQVVVDVYDPTYFSAFDFVSGQVLTIEAEDGVACSTSLIVPAKDSPQLRDYRAFVAAFGPFAARIVTPRSIVLSCSDPAAAANLDVRRNPLGK